MSKTLYLSSVGEMVQKKNPAILLICPPAYRIMFYVISMAMHGINTADEDGGIHQGRLYQACSHDRRLHFEFCTGRWNSWNSSTFMSLFSCKAVQMFRNVCASTAYHLVAKNMFAQ